MVYAPVGRSIVMTKFVQTLKVREALDSRCRNIMYVFKRGYVSLKLSPVRVSVILHLVEV